MTKTDSTKEHSKENCNKKRRNISPRLAIKMIPRKERKEKKPNRRRKNVER